MSAAARVAWVDVAKGIGIFLVVEGHVLPGLQSAGLLPTDEQSPGLRFLHDWTYAFHMPLFFFLSGLFVLRSAQGGLARFLDGKLRTVLYPYLL